MLCWCAQDWVRTVSESVGLPPMRCWSETPTTGVRDYEPASSSESWHRTMTTQRSIAEIIWGITSQPCINRREPKYPEVTASCEEFNCLEWVSSDGRTEYSLEAFGEPSVDDMLTWLRAHGWDWGASSRRDGSIEFGAASRDDDETGFTSRAQTLAAALEAAVRGVAG